jgi:hypothetical protein
MQHFPIQTLKKPSAWIPIAMSVTALVAVLVQLLTQGPVPEADEGALAHIWQLLMAGQLPLVVWFAVRWLRPSPRQAWPVLATQVVAAASAMLPVALLGW